MTVASLKIVDLVLDEEIQPRLRLDQRKIDEYAQLYVEEMALPPIVIFQDADHCYVADGFHRTQAAIKAGLEQIPAEVRQGTRRDALLYASAANSTHGLPLTAEDKRRIVTRLLADPECGQWSDREIARHCGVSHDFVSRLRRSLSSDDSEPSPRTYTTRHGTVTTMDTSRIGRSTSKPPAPAEAAAAPPEVLTEPEALEAVPVVLADGISLLVHTPSPEDVGSAPPADQHLPSFDLADLVEDSVKILDEIAAQLAKLVDAYPTCTTAESTPFRSAWAFATAPKPSGRGCDLGTLLTSAAPLITLLETLKTQAETATPLPAAQVTNVQRVHAVLPDLPAAFSPPQVAAQTGLTTDQARRALRTLVKNGALSKGEDGRYSKRKRTSSKTERGASSS